MCESTFFLSNSSGSLQVEDQSSLKDAPLIRGRCLIQLFIPCTGYYAYIESSPPRYPGQVSRLRSKWWIPKNFGKKCMSFFYNMNGKHIGYLDLFLKTKSGKFVNLWRKTGHQAPEWRNAEVQLKKMNEPYLVSRHLSYATKSIIKPSIFTDLWLYTA